MVRAITEITPPPGGIASKITPERKAPGGNPRGSDRVRSTGSVSFQIFALILLLHFAGVIAGNRVSLAGNIRGGVSMGGGISQNM